MPIYRYESYQVDAEGEKVILGVFEVLQKVGEPELTAHPETGHPARRIIAPFAIRNPDVIHDGASRAEERRIYNNWYEQYQKDQEANVKAKESA